MKAVAHRGLAWGLAGLSALALVACGGGLPATDQGTLQVELTDAPACGFDQVSVTVDRVRVHQSATAAASDSGWSELIPRPAPRIDLLTLTNGAPAYSLGRTTVPAGQYQQVRLVLVMTSAVGTPANAVVPSGGTAEVALQTPTSLQTGVRIDADFSVEAAKVTDLLLDFDACRSIVPTGTGGYQLKPVFKVVPASAVGGIAGALATTLSETAVTQARVSAQKDGTVLHWTVPDADGKYTLWPLDARQSPLDLVVALPGAATVIVTAVPVEIGGTTDVPSIQMPAASTMATVSGTVTPSAALPATLRALQAAGSVPQVEVAVTNATLLGGYSMSLPKAAPQLATFATSTLSFSASGTAGSYTIEATDVNGNRKTVPASVTLGNTTGNFAFP